MDISFSVRYQKSNKFPILLDQKFSYLRNFHLKYLQSLLLICLPDHLCAQVLGDHQVIRRFYHQVLFVPHLLFLLFLSLMFVFVNQINYLLVQILVVVSKENNHQVVETVVKNFLIVVVQMEELVEFLMVVVVKKIRQVVVVVI